MNGTVKVLYYKTKTLSNGEHPLMRCVCKDNKRKYQSLVISAQDIHLLQTLSRTRLTETQFAQIVGRMRLYPTAIIVVCLNS